MLQKYPVYNIIINPILAVCVIIKHHADPNTYK